MMQGFRLRFFAALLAASAAAAPAAIPMTVSLKPVFDQSKLRLQNVIWFGEMPGHPGWFVAVELGGTIQVIRESGGEWQKTQFARITVSFGGEMGLLGLAFHPEFVSNRKYYLNYNPNGSTTLIEEREADSTFLKDAGKARQVLRIPQPAWNHNGGTINFSPKDGYLYIGMGDGGASSDASQDKASVLGKFLRVDVNAPDSFKVPADNPFVGQAGWHPAVWASGMRNPWKWEFDPLTGDLWAGDVGGSSREEMSLVPKGGNLGWPIHEGELCNRGTAACAASGATPAAVGLTRAQSTIVVGGRVYRGHGGSPYYGLVFFADFDKGTIWAMRHQDGKLLEYDTVAVSPTGVSSFGTDLQGNLYVASYGGTVYRLEGLDAGAAARPRSAASGRRGMPLIRRGAPWRLQGPPAAGRVDVLTSQGRLMGSLEPRADGSLPAWAWPEGIYLLLAPASGLRQAVLVH